MFTIFIRFFKKIGFSLGSSRYLADALVRHAGVNKEHDVHILELGAGDGTVTREILRQLTTGSRLTSIEREYEHIPHLSTLSHPHITVIHDDAQHIGKHLEPESIDIIISTLPLGSLDRDTVENILTESKRVLKKDSIFIQYQYWMANKKDIKRHFHIKKIGFEPRNFSPAFIYIAQKK